jgi:hypothetical protein
VAESLADKPEDYFCVSFDGGKLEHFGESTAEYHWNKMDDGRYVAMVLIYGAGISDKAFYYEVDMFVDLPYPESLFDFCIEQSFPAFFESIKNIAD